MRSLRGQVLKHARRDPSTEDCLTTSDHRTASTISSGSAVRPCTERGQHGYVVV
jgi:hypothetical protein